MFEYHSRLFNHYGRPLVSLALLTDNQTRWRPEHFGYELCGCRLRLDFPTQKLLDYGQDWAALEADSNPFAVVTMAHLQAQATSPDSANRRDAKFRLARRLYQRGYTRQMILDLFRFIDWLLALTPARESEFEVALIAYEKEHSMQYITSIERRGREVGSREGIEQGLEQGLEQGQALGRLAAMREGIVELLAMRFTAVPEEIVARLEAIVDPAGLRQRLRLAANIDSLTAFEQALTDFA